MKIRHGMKSWIAAVFFVAVAGVASAAETYEIDAVHSAAAFKIKHLGISFVKGDFSGIAGTIVIDKANTAASVVDVTIDVGTISTNNGRRDEHLKSADFFDAATYPTMSFKSAKVVKLKGGDYRVTGNFTLRGVTKKITLIVSQTGEGKGPDGKKRVGFEAIFKIKRSDYGMSKDVPLIGDEVVITFNAEAILK